MGRKSTAVLRCFRLMYPRLDKSRKATCRNGDLWLKYCLLQRLAIDPRLKYRNENIVVIFDKISWGMSIIVRCSFLNTANSDSRYADSGQCICVVPRES